MGVMDGMRCVTSDLQTPVPSSKAATAPALALASALGVASCPLQGHLLACSRTPKGRVLALRAPVAADPRCNLAAGCNPARRYGGCTNNVAASDPRIFHPSLDL
jgi:hypothetical protein